MVPVNNWLVANAGFLPFFAEPADNVTNMSTGGTLLTAGIVLAVMILPIITAVTREVFVQTPVAHREAALALGATKWEVVRTAVLPFGFSGYISGSMLGLGRARRDDGALYPHHLQHRADELQPLRESGARPSRRRSRTTPPNSICPPRPGRSSPPDWPCSC